MAVMLNHQWLSYLIFKKNLCHSYLRFSLVLIFPSLLVIQELFLDQVNAAGRAVMRFIYIFFLINYYYDYYHYSLIHVSFLSYDAPLSVHQTGLVAHFMFFQSEPDIFLCGICTLPSNVEYIIGILYISWVVSGSSLSFVSSVYIGDEKGKWLLGSVPCCLSWMKI